MRKRVTVNHSYLLMHLIVLFILAGYGYSGEPNQLGHWIAVTPASLHKSIEPLCEYRKQEGFNVTVISIEDILNKSILGHYPSAIQDYLFRQYDKLEGDVYVVLVGAVRSSGKVDECTLMTLPGQHGRMKELPCDFRYTSSSDDIPDNVVLGRLPGRTPTEIEQMVEKILYFERSTKPGPWKHRLSIMAGNPGGQSWMEKQLSGMVVQMIGQECLSRIHPFWNVDGFIHVKGSEFYVPDEQLPSRAKSMLEKGQFFSFYLGHSAPTFLSSDGIDFLTQQDWKSLNMSHLQGVLFTCGCYAEWISRNELSDGYALTAMRNPKGPVAVIGAFAESYGAIGQLAFEGMVDCLKLSQPPRRLGDYWKSVQNGIASGSIDPALFTLFDYVDGSKGKTTLDFQRLEHLEMWSLFGDPAMRIPLPEDEVHFDHFPPIRAGQTVQVKGAVPSDYEGGTVHLTLEKTLRKPKQLADADTWLGVSGYANGAFILDKTETVVEKGAFSGQLNIPELTSPAEIIIRAAISNGNQDTMSVETLEID